MPFNGNGVFQAPASPGAFNPAMPGSSATPVAWNTLLDDVETGLSTTWCRDGQSTVTADIPMRAHKFTGLAAGTAGGNSVRYDEFYVAVTPTTTGGTSTAYTLTYGVDISALVDGMTNVVQFNAANGVAATLNVNALGAIPLQYYAAGDWRVAPSGLIGANQIVRVAYHAGSVAYRLLGLQNRTGEVVPFAGATAPAGSLLCYGQAISRTDYVGLFTALGTVYGAGDGTTTFNLPDLRGRVAGGKDNMGGSAAGRLTGGTVLGAPLGLETKESLGPTTGGVLVTNSALNISVSQDGHTHNVAVIQPTIVLNYIIRI
jgi:hypothetical protein